MRYKPSDLPGWPRLLVLSLVAAYTGRSENTFREEMRQGIWPEPLPKGFGEKRRSAVWDRQEIDRRIDEQQRVGQSGRSKSDMLENLSAGLTKRRKKADEAARR